jgi:CheY-like chemotaxis protein
MQPVLASECHGPHAVLGQVYPRNAREVFAAHSDEIDLLLTDVLMPEMNGPELARKLRRLRPRLPILYMSGCTETAILDSVDSILLSKPCSPDELAAAQLGAPSLFLQKQLCTNHSPVLFEIQASIHDLAMGEGADPSLFVFSENRNLQLN